MKGIHKKDQEKFLQFLMFTKNVLNSEDVKTCLKVQKAMSELGIPSPIDKVIVEKKYLDVAIVTNLIQEFRGGDEDFIPGYRVLQKLGEGAMGEVYKAVEIDSGKVVAIKVLFSHLGKKKSTAKRFLQEAEICKKLSHSNIVKGFEVGYEADKDFYFYAMEYIEGITLGDYIKKHGIMSEHLIIKIAQQMASALEMATRLNLVHRDIKPDNIILTKENNAKLCDLGLARNYIEDSSLTMTGAVMGTPFYISPEAVRGEELDSQSDIYSLGATLFYISIGKVPFEGKTRDDIFKLHNSDIRIIPPIELRPNLSANFSAVIEKMMEKKISDRYQSASELMKDLELVKKGKKTIAIAERKQNHPAISENLKDKENIKIKSEESLRQSRVEEYSIGSSKAPKLFDNFFTSTEQRVISNVKWKLFLLIGFTGLIVLLIIALLVFTIVRFF